MRYEKQVYEWTTLLTANVEVTENLVRVLETRFYPKGSAKLAQGYNREAEPIRLSVWSPDELVVGVKADVRLEKRNDGMKRITFYPGENDGLSMDVEDIVKQVAKWVGACEGGTQEILEELRGKDSNDEEEDE